MRAKGLKIINGNSHDTMLELFRAQLSLRLKSAENSAPNLRSAPRVVDLESVWTAVNNLNSIAALTLDTKT